MSSFAAAGLLALALLSRRVQADCESFGVDFQDGGSYFQNISSTDPFTFVSIFEGCQDDICNNILVDPNGDEYQCSDTDLTPDDKNQLSTCPIDKDQLLSGDWSVVLISNNGDADPIAYERDFYLTVGIPATVTYTPTIVVSSTSTPLYSVTSTSTTSDTITNVVTVTSASITLKPTTTVTPARVTSTKTITIGTIYTIAVTAIPTVVTRTATASCSVPPRQQNPDPTATITPTLITAAALTPSATASSTTRRRHRDSVRRVPSDRAARIAERKARLAAARLDKRAPDSPTLTLTDSNSADFVTSTSIITAATSTVTVPTITTVFTTTTSTSTTLSGTTVLSQVTITAPTPTKTVTQLTLAYKALLTLTQHPRVTVTSTTTPPALAATCSAQGGTIV